jgi:predicted nucleic acid-binding protein
LIALARIGRLNLLGSFYERILIPAEVQYEVTVAERAFATRAFEASLCPRNQLL